MALEEFQDRPLSLLDGEQVSRVKKRVPAIPGKLLLARGILKPPALKIIPDWWQGLTCFPKIEAGLCHHPSDARI
jgi:hypothetical protein